MRFKHNRCKHRTVFVSLIDRRESHAVLHRGDAADLTSSGTGIAGLVRRRQRVMMEVTRK